MGPGASPGALISILSLPNGAYITNTFDAVGRETGTRLKNSGGSTLNSHQYVYNAADERTRMTATAGNYQDYTYDTVWELLTASGKESGGATRLHEQFSYVYDRAGNLRYRTNNALSLAFNVDDLNQLATVSRNSGTTTGVATNVTVNGLTATRYADNTFAVAGVPLTNANNTFTAVAKDSYGRIDTNSVSVILPGRWTFL